MRDYRVDMMPGCTIIVSMSDEGDSTGLLLLLITELLSLKVFYHFLQYLFSIFLSLAEQLLKHLVSILPEADQLHTSSLLDLYLCLLLNWLNGWSYYYLFLRSWLRNFLFNFFLRDSDLFLLFFFLRL